MTTFSEFRRWLWSDWGKPNFLTRLGIPRVITYLLAYLLGPYLFYWLTLRYVPMREVEKQNFRMSVHNAFFLLAYAVFFITATTSQFVDFKYSLKGLSWDVRIKRGRETWKDPFVKVFWASFACVFVLLFLGWFRLIHQIK